MEAKSGVEVNASLGIGGPYRVDRIWALAGAGIKLSATGSVP